MYVSQGDLRPEKWVKNTQSSSASVQRWQLDLSDLPYQKRSEEEKSGCRMRSHSGEGHREGEGKGVRSTGEVREIKGGMYLWDHAAFRCEGSRTRGVKISEVYSSAEPIFHNHCSFFSLSLSLELSSFLPVTLPLTFLPLTFKLFFSPPPTTTTTTTITPPSCSLCNSLQCSVLLLFSWPGLLALLAISSGLSLGKTAGQVRDTSESWRRKTEETETNSSNIVAVLAS